MTENSMAEIRQAKAATQALRLKRSLASALMWCVTIAIMAFTAVYAYRRMNPPQDPVLISKTPESPVEILPEEPKRNPPSKRVALFNPELERLKRENERLRREERERNERDVMVARRRTIETPEPDPVAAVKQSEPDSEPTLAEIEAERKRIELLALRKEAATQHAARNPGKLKTVLLKLKKLEPKDPRIDFGLGEVYASVGLLYNQSKARSAFRKFLKLAKGKGFHDLCGKAEEYLDLLKHKRRLFLVTPSKTLEAAWPNRKRRIGNLKRYLRADKAECDRLLARLNPPMRAIARNVKLTKLQSLRAKLSQRERWIETLEGELERIETALSGLKTSHCEEEETTSGPHRG